MASQSSPPCICLHSRSGVAAEGRARSDGVGFRSGSGYDIVAWDNPCAFARARHFGVAPFFGNGAGPLASRVVTAASVGSPTDAQHPTPAQ